MEEIPPLRYPPHMREHLRRYRLPLAFLLAALALALPPSDREWLTKMYYPILFGRYSTARVAWILSLLLMSLTALLRAESLLHSLPREQRWARFRVNLLIPAYTLAAAFGMVEFYFQHNPSRVSGRHDETWVESLVFQRMAERPKDEELGILGTPNMETDNSELLEYSVPLLYAPAEWNRLPFPRVRYRSDSDGFRNDTQVNQADLVVIGDSFTHAPMIERSEIWSSVLASRLGISELNLGICGYGPQQEARALWRYGIKRGPKLVVMQVFLGNDVQDSLVFKRWKTSGMGYVEFQREQHGVRPIVPTWVFLANLARQVLPAPGKEKWDKTPGWFRPVELQLRDGRIPVGFDPDLRILLRSEREWSRSEGLDTLILSIMEARAITTRARAKFAVMLIPTKTRVLYDFIANQENRSRFYTQQATFLSDFDPDELERLHLENRDSLATVLGQFLDRQRVARFDFTQPFVDRTQTDGELLYYALDAHWTPEGHRFAGETLAQWVRDRGLLPAEGTPFAGPH